MYRVYNDNMRSVATYGTANLKAKQESNLANNRARRIEYCCKNQKFEARRKYRGAIFVKVVSTFDASYGRRDSAQALV